MAGLHDDDFPKEDPKHARTNHLFEGKQVGDVAVLYSVYQLDFEHRKAQRIVYTDDPGKAVRELKWLRESFGTPLIQYELEIDTKIIRRLEGKARPRSFLRYRPFRRKANDNDIA